jgi:hypothetical protein
VIAYASRTGTRVNLAGLRARGWRLLVSATGAHRTEGFAYALDNGEWTVHQKKAKKWADPRSVVRAFIRLVIALGAGADWIAAPDVVQGGLASLAKSRKWLPWLLKHTRRVLIPVQDGMSVDDVRPHLSHRVGVFVGGSTTWKEQTMGAWAHLARETGSWCHVGRVNTARRIAICAAAGADSFDGTCASRFLKQQPLLQRARVQLSLLVEPIK